MSSHAARVHHLGAQDFHTNWDQVRPPRLVIDPGDTVIFETMEASGGAIARMVAGGTKTLGDPAITGAAPGDTLVVRSEAVTVGSWGWTSCSPEGNGLPQHEVPEHTLYLWNLREPGRAPFAPGITAPLAPFCGVMGVAPAEAGPLSTLPPRTTGGNLDVRALTAGATLSLPVQVAGALFSVGDVHAAQGDGEVCGTAIETSASARACASIRASTRSSTARWRRSVRCCP